MSVIALALGFVLLVAQAPADPNAVTLLSNDDAGSEQCGGDQLAWTNAPSFDVAHPGFVTMRATAADGTVDFDLARPLVPGEKLIPLWCGDLLGDGSEVLGYELFSGGAHCCFSVSVVPLSPGADHLLDVDLGNGGLTAPDQLDGGGPLELVGGSDVFAYFDDLSFAASPFLPLVYAYDGQDYVEATRQFPALLRDHIRQAEADLSEVVARPADPDVPKQFRFQEQESVALRLYGLHVLLGDPDQALADLESRVSPEAANWLAANASAASDAMSRVYNLS